MSLPQKLLQFALSLSEEIVQSLKRLLYLPQSSKLEFAEKQFCLRYEDTRLRHCEIVVLLSKTPRHRSTRRFFWHEKILNAWTGTQNMRKVFAARVS